MRAHPNLTNVDVGNVLHQLHWVLAQMVTAMEFLFAFTLLSGVLVPALHWAEVRPGAGTGCHHRVSSVAAEAHGRQI
jgi:predicted lysophospholipase L1 biosynthesis ABC-type transport system permease subunit